MRNVSLPVVAVVALSLVALGPARTAAQSSAPRPLVELGTADASGELGVLRRVVGDRARVVLDVDGRTLRTLLGAALPPAHASFETSAVAALTRFGPLFGLPQGATFVVRDVVSAHGFSIAHVARTIDGREVALASIVVRARPDGQIDLIHVDAMPPRTIPWPAQARADAAEAVALSVSGFGTPRTVSTREVLLALGDAVRPAFELEIAGARHTELTRVHVDPASAEVLLVTPLVLDVTGRVYANNPTTDADIPVDVDLSDLTSRDFLVGRHVRVMSCDQSGSDCPTIQHAVADADGNFLFDPVPRTYDDAFAEVSAYHHMSRVVGYMETAHGFDWACGLTETMNVYVNYTEAPNTPYDNAAFSPGGGGRCGFLLFGQGGSDDFAYDGDVVYHEFGHAVTDAITDLGFFGAGNSPNYDPLAINEGTSDYWASAVQGNAEIAESISIFEGGRGGSLRTIDGAVTCPYDLIGEGHYDGRLWSGLGWDTRVALGQERADAMFFVAVTTTSGSADLSAAAANFLATAMSYEAMGRITAEELATVEATIHARGLDACGHTIPLDDGRAHEGYSGNEFITAAIAHGLAPIHYSLQIPADIINVEVDVEHATFAGEVTVHFSSGLPVRSSVSRIASQHQVPIGRSGTALWGTDTGLLPCQTLYIGVETTDIRTAGQSLYSIIARMNTTGDPAATCPLPVPDAGMPDANVEPDAGVAPDAAALVTPPPPAGCACRAAARASRSEEALLLAALALMVSRLRRRARAR